MNSEIEVDPMTEPPVIEFEREEFPPGPYREFMEAMSGMDIDDQVMEKEEIHVVEPKRWRVIIFNDDRTTFDFVIYLLTTVFNHTVESAAEITIKVHEEGSGTAGIYSEEISEEKTEEARALIAQTPFPLQVDREPIE